MSLNDDIELIKAVIKTLAIGQGAILNALSDLSDKIDGIKSNSDGNTTNKTRIFNELTVLLNFIAKGKKIGAIEIAERLTGCSRNEARNLVEIIHVTNND